MNRLKEAVGGELLLLLARLRILSSSWLLGSRCSSTDSQQFLDLFSREILGAAEDVRFGAALTAQLVDLDHFTEGDETDESILRQQAEGGLEGILVMENNEHIKCLIGWLTTKLTAMVISKLVKSMSLEGKTSPNSHPIPK